jgi:acetyl-CoA carboxylase biotin carboxyl carrier protein
MTIDEIKQIIQVLTESGVSEIEVQRGENRVWIKRTPAPGQELQITVPVPSVQAAVVNTPPSNPQNSVPAPSPQSPPETYPVIKAPIVGTFYESPSPDSPVFVKVGDTFQPGQVLCIIESMKLMNEIEAECSGVIVSKLVPNGKPVEYGESLFTYQPL